MEATAVIARQEEQEKQDLMDKGMFEKQVNKSKIERALLELYHMQQQYRDLGEQIKFKKEEIHDLYIDAEIPAIVTQSDDGTYICVQEKIVDKEVLDKDGLALELNIEKKEIAKPWDYSILTYQGKLTPAMITRHTHPETSKDIKITKTKRNPLEKDKKKRRFKKKF